MVANATLPYHGRAPCSSSRGLCVGSRRAGGIASGRNAPASFLPSGPCIKTTSMRARRFTVRQMVSPSARARLAECVVWCRLCLRLRASVRVPGSFSGTRKTHGVGLAPLLSYLLNSLNKVNPPAALDRSSSSAARPISDGTW